MKRSERKLVTEAANIISRELEAGREVRVPNFGAFKLSTIEVCLEHPMSEDYGAVPTHLQDKVVFRPFELLKKLVRNRRKRCQKRTRMQGGYMAPCYHKGGEGHEGPCVDGRGRPLEEI